MGVPIPPKSIIQAATLQDKEELVQQIEAQEQQQSQIQQMQFQKQMELMQAQIDDLQGKYTANVGLGVERMSRQNENAELAIERRAKAIEDISDARLNRAKTLAELQNIDLTQIENLLRIAQLLTLQGETAAEAQALTSDTVTPQGQRSGLIAQGIGGLQ